MVICLAMPGLATANPARIITAVKLIDLPLAMSLLTRFDHSTDPACFLLIMGSPPSFLIKLIKLCSGIRAG